MQRNLSAYYNIQIIILYIYTQYQIINLYNIAKTRFFILHIIYCLYIISVFYYYILTKISNVKSVYNKIII